MRCLCVSVIVSVATFQVTLVNALNIERQSNAHILTYRTR